MANGKEETFALNDKYFYYSAVAKPSSIICNILCNRQVIFSQVLWSLTNIVTEDARLQCRVWFSTRGLCRQIFVVKHSLPYLHTLIRGGVGAYLRGELNRGFTV